VAAVKAWETSLTRHLCLTALTYIVAASFLLIIREEKPFIFACVPAISYFLSTLVLHRIRDRWVARRQSDKSKSQTAVQR